MPHAGTLHHHDHRSRHDHGAHAAHDGHDHASHHPAGHAFDAAFEPAPADPHAHHAQHAGHSAHAGHAGHPTSLNRIALMATVHCLLGCAIGEAAGMVIGTALGWGNGATIALAVTLAFVSGFALTAVPFLRGGMRMGDALRLALAADTASIAIMEVVDNLMMLVIPGAMDAPLDSGRFWLSMGVALLVAGGAAFPVNRWLISKGKGHALAHGHH